MAKHSKGKSENIKQMKEKNKNTNNSEMKSKNEKHIIETIIIVTLIFFGLIFGIIYTYQSWNKIKDAISSRQLEQKDATNFSIINDITIENERLVMRSLYEHNKIVEYKFEDNTLKEVFIYEQFTEKEQFENKKQNYEKQKNIIIKNIDEENLSIEIEKKDLGTDKGLSYDKIYDKYIVQIIGAYEIK